MQAGESDYSVLSDLFVSQYELMSEWPCGNYFRYPTNYGLSGDIYTPIICNENIPEGKIIEKIKLKVISYIFGRF